MNEKLTPEQRDWIMRLVETHLPETMGRQIVREALTALTPEDEVNKGVYIPPYNIAEDECNHENAAHNFQSCPDCGKSLQPHTTEDDPSRYQTTLEVQAEYLKELNKYSKEKSWEEGQSQSGLFMWLGMKLQQEDNDE